MERCIFEDVREKIGCTYISDLHFCQEKVKKTLKKMDLTSYSQGQMNDFCQYVFGVSHDDMFCNGRGVYQLDFDK